MERKKLPSDTPLDALIEAAIANSEEITLDHDVFESDVIAFLSHYKITGGQHKIPADSLYKLYCIWSKNRIKRNQFSLQLSLYIPKEARYYLINKDSSEIISDLSSVIKKKKSPLIRKRANWDHFKAFLNAHSISNGEDWVEAHVLFHFYDKWIYNTNRKKRISNHNLLQFLKITFEHRATKDGYVMKLSHNFESSSIENLREAWKRKIKGPK